jgi:hypothetical protein
VSKLYIVLRAVSTVSIDVLLKISGDKGATIENAKQFIGST